MNCEEKIMLTFKCLRCGTCCNNLIVESSYGTQKGLIIFPEERLFPTEVVFPFFGVGKMPEDKYFRIVTYQVNARTCPHLKRNKLAMCNIHERRPLVCRAFPFKYQGNPFNVMECRLAVYRECLFVQKSKLPSPKKIDAPIEKKAAEQMLWKMSIRKGTQWYFDLKEKEWIPIAEI